MDRIRAAGATPMIPEAWPTLSPWPAMMLAMDVPSIAQDGAPGASPDPVKSGPVTTEPVRSGWVASNPLLSTATVIPAPRETCQACGTCRLPSHHS